MPQNRLRQYVCSILLTVGCAFALMGSPDCFAAVQDFSGSFINNESGKSAEVRFTVPEHSEVDFEFNSICENPLTFSLNGAYNQASPMGKAIVEQYSSNAVIGKLPLYKGDYIARIICPGELYDPPPSPEWTMKITSRVINVPNYREDQEPPSDTPVDVFSSKCFSGWLDLWGTPASLNPVTYQDNGLDSRDIITVNMKKGTKLKVKVEWEFTTTKPDPVDLTIALYRYKNGGLYYVELPFTSTDNPATSQEITLLEDGVYKIYLTTFSWTDKKRYGGYRVSLLLNGQSVPGNLLLTFQSAKWVRQSNSSSGEPYSLEVKFQIENTYDESRKVRNSISLFAPVLKMFPDSTRFEMESAARFELLAYFATIAQDAHCSTTSDKEWDEFCPNNRLGEGYLYDGQEAGHNCLYSVTLRTSEYYTLPAHSTTEQTMLLPASLDEYRNFDESLQNVLLVIQDQALHPVSGSDDCHMYGLYYMPVRAVAPSINLLLSD